MPRRPKRREGGDVVKQRLFQCYRDEVEDRQALDAALHHLSQERDDPAAVDLLHEILEAKATSPCVLENGFEEIDYRRSFDINDLRLTRGVPEVFETRHKAIALLVSTGKITVFGSIMWTVSTGT